MFKGGRIGALGGIVLGLGGIVLVRLSGGRGGPLGRRSWHKT
jgi:hypothetical protein